MITLYKEYIDNLNSQNLCKYLRLHGWSEISSLRSGKIKQFEKEGVDDSVLIPMTKTFSDYYEVYTESLDTLSTSESTTIISLLNKLINPSCDIIKWRIAGSDTFRGSIPFESMINNIDFIKELFSVSYLDIKSPAIFHKKVGTKDVENQIKQYKFGQTEIGSYILNILSPLGVYQYQLFDPTVEDLPINRKININLLNTIDQIQKSIQDHSTELNDKVQEKKISVNFLMALSDLYAENKDSNVSIIADWNKDVPNVQGSVIVQMVKLYPRCIDKVLEVAEANTPKEEHDIQKTYYGKIIDIGGEAELDNRSTIKIKIVTIGDEGRKITIQTELAAENYTIVETAFEYSNNVKVSGKLNKHGHTNILSDAEIEIVNE